MTEPTEDMKVISARIVGRLMMLVTFSTGEERVFDATQLLDRPAFAPLDDPKVFSDYHVDHGILCWADGGIDIAPERLHAMSLRYDRTA